MTIDDLGEKLDGVITTVDDLGEKLDGVATTVDGLVVKVDKLEAKVDKLETKTDRLENKLDAVAASVDDLALITQRSFDGLEERMATKDDLREGLHDIRRELKLVDRREQVDELDGRVTILERKLGT